MEGINMCQNKICFQTTTIKNVIKFLIPNELGSRIYEAAPKKTSQFLFFLQGDEAEFRSFPNIFVVLWSCFSILVDVITCTKTMVV